MAIEAPKVRTKAGVAPAHDSGAPTDRRAKNAGFPTKFLEGLHGFIDLHLLPLLSYFMEFNDAKFPQLITIMILSHMSCPLYQGFGWMERI